MIRKKVRLRAHLFWNYPSKMLHNAQLILDTNILFIVKLPHMFVLYL